MDWLIRLLWRFQFRGKMRLFTRFIPRSGERVANVFGTRASLDLGDLIQRLVYLGCYEPEETEVVSSYLRPGMTFVDGGANVGYFTCLAASLVGPTGRLVAIEPDPVLFNRLERTIRENQLANVSCVQAALARSPGEISLSIPPAELANRAPVAGKIPDWEQVPVRARTLDELLTSLAVGRVDLLKLDVEGFEGEVLAGASKSIAEGRIRAILCEFNDYWLRANGTTPAELWQLLTSKGLTAAKPQPTWGPESLTTALFTARPPRR